MVVHLVQSTHCSVQGSVFNPLFLTYRKESITSGKTGLQGDSLSLLIYTFPLPPNFSQTLKKVDEGISLYMY